MASEIAGEVVPHMARGVLDLSAQASRDEFLREVEAEAETKVSVCYQCGKCAGSCPVSFAMDWEPFQIMRLVQLGAVEEVLNSRAIWVCVSCTACSERCPREVDVAAVMDALRILARRKGYRAPEGEIATFHNLFLDTVRAGGRLHELGLMARYKLGTMNLFSDLDVGMTMMRYGKLKLLPHRIAGTDSLRNLFARVRERGQRGERR